MRRRVIRFSLAAVVVLVLAVWVIRLPRPSPEYGPAQLYGHLWCMGVKFDSGDAHPVDTWPSGMHVREQSLDLGRVLVDDKGTVLFREGDRVFVSATLRHADGGDTACANLDSLAVDSISLLASPAP